MTRTIIPLRETDNTPTVILHRTLAKVKRIKSVVVVIQWNEEGAPDQGAGWSWDWSTITSSEFAMAAAVLNFRSQMHLREHYNPLADDIPTDPPEPPQVTTE